MIAIVDYHINGSKWTKHDMIGAVFYMMRFMNAIVYMIAIVDCHYGSTWTKHDIFGAVFQGMNYIIL